MTLQPREAGALFGDPGARIFTTSPEHFAYWAGCEAGFRGEARRYADADPRVVQYWLDGHRLGGLFRPVVAVGHRHRRDHGRAVAAPKGAGGHAGVNVARWLEEQRARFGTGRART